MRTKNGRGEERKTRGIFETHGIEGYEWWKIKNQNYIDRPILSISIAFPGKILSHIIISLIFLNLIMSS